MPIDFGDSTLQSFSALKPQKGIYTTSPCKVQNSYKMYLPNDFTNTFNLNKGDKVYVSYSETEDLLYLDTPETTDNLPYIKELRIHIASYATKYIILPKKLMARYGDKVSKITLVQEDTSRIFKLLFYSD